jgi:hypothetical protein
VACTISGETGAEGRGITVKARNQGRSNAGKKQEGRQKEDIWCVVEAQVC